MGARVGHVAASAAVSDHQNCPPDLLDALSRLNGHARAWGCGKRAIYAYKALIACAYAEQADPVFVMVRCDHCGGTGQYRDRDGYPRGPCYRCTKGIVTLKFVESRIGETRWHHPVGSGGWEVMNAAWGTVSTRYEGIDTICTLPDGTERRVAFRQAEGWGPHMPAEKLPTDEACRLLNLVEGAIEDIPTHRPETRWKRAAALQQVDRYSIELDRVPEGCCVCGADGEFTRCGCLSWHGGFASFYRPMCPVCHGTGPTLRWPDKPHPASLTPNVVAWLAHPLRQRQRRTEETW